MKTFKSAIMAGICIGIGGFVNLATGGIVGSIFFAFGLLTVVHYKYKLFTGTAGFISKTKEDIKDLGIIFIGNLVGIILTALLSKCSPLNIDGTKVLTTRIECGWLSDGLLAIACGFMMTTAVKFGREGKFLPLLFAVPTFILCGFPHSIADVFYYATVPVDFLINHWLVIFELYCAIVFGNFIGCNLSRWLLPES